MLLGWAHYGSASTVSCSVYRPPGKNFVHKRRFCLTAGVLPPAEHGTGQACPDNPYTGIVVYLRVDDIDDALAPW